MSADTTSRSADSATYPTDVAYLPGRTVTDGEATGVVTETIDGNTVTVRWDGWFNQTCTVTELRLINPDRPTLAEVELYANELGLMLAEWAGRADDWRGEPTLQVGWREAARDMLRRLDHRMAAVQTARCTHTYVVDRNGQRRPDPIGFVDGDRLVTCTFHVDGPGAVRCGPHSGDRGSIFHPTPADMVVPEDCRAIRDVVALSPYKTAGPVRVEVAA